MFLAGNEMSRLRLLRGRISRVESYESPQTGGGSPIPLPSPEPAAHSERLLKQLDEIERQVRARDPSVRDELATRELITISPAIKGSLAPQQLDDSRTDVRLIGTTDTGQVLLDVPSPRVEHIRDKVAAFADDARVKIKQDTNGNVLSVQRACERAVAPIDTLRLAATDDLAGQRLRSETLVEGRAYWFEVACRGGYRRPRSETETSRAQLARQLLRLGWTAKLDEFVGPELVYFFVRLSKRDLEQLRASTDCIYEVELAPPPLRDLMILEEATSADIRELVLTPPPLDAPAVIVLDTGISTGHPLLRSALLPSTKAGEEIPSPEDTHGHGTKMAGVALYRDIGEAIQRGYHAASHWIHSSRLLVAPNQGTASDENYEKWPVLTQGAIRAVEVTDQTPRNRVFTLAITRSMQEPPLDTIERATLWSQAVDQLAYNDGNGRLIVVSAGNARDAQWSTLVEGYPQAQLTEKVHQPAQAANALTVGAYTSRVTLPPCQDYAEARLAATKPDGISPFTSTGSVQPDWPVKPDVVMEGGNLAISGALTDAGIPTLCTLTTSHRHQYGRPLGQLSMTSEAAARVARLAAEIWSVEPKLHPETVRGLIVHSSSWSNEMQRQFRVTRDRLAACGYGIPDEDFARACAANRATIIIEDVMPNAVREEELKKQPPKRAGTKTTEPKVRRKQKIFRLPLPEDLLLQSTDANVELRVTLSYFAEPNKYGRSAYHGLDLKWDMQGPQEDEDEFLERINKLQRPIADDGKRKRSNDSSKSFSWELGSQIRGRGTVQSDRWHGKMSALAGDKLIAVMPVLGWWDQRKDLKTQTMRFSLIVSVLAPGIYATIKPLVEIPLVPSIQV